MRLPGSKAVLEDEVLERIDRSGKQGMTAEALLKRVDSESSRDSISLALGKLQAEGAIVKKGGHWVALRHTGLSSGNIQVLERGDALIRSGSKGEPGWFVRRRHRKGALDGALVLFKRAPQGKSKRQASSFRLPEAMVVEVVQQRHRTVVGTLEGDDQRRWLVPFDPKLNLEIEVEGGDDLLEDQYVVVELDPRRTGSRGPARARVQEVLGSVETPGVDVEVVVRHYQIPDRFPEDVRAEAEHFPDDPPVADFKGRQDLRDHTVVTIDGETSRDFDDAISIEPLSGDRFLLGVHIADVSAYVREGSPLDLEAYRRGTSVYYPDRAIPMLPENLSNGLCSLKPGVPRLTLSAWTTVEPDGSISDRRFSETVIQSQRRFTYTQVSKILDDSAAGDHRQDDPTIALLHRAGTLMSRLFKRRTERGSIDFDLPEGDVILDPDGFTVGVRPGERNQAHRIIEECMIAANEAVAAELSGHEIPSLYRIHNPPNPDDLESLREVLKGLGISLKGDLQSLHPEVLQRLLERVRDKPEEAFVTSMVLRSMQRAVYDPECKGHYALSSRFYTHFTSPIRRYPDLLVHRQLKKTLHRADEAEEKEDGLVKRLPAIAEHCSSTERRAERSERVLMQWKLVRFLANRVGETFSGRVTGVQPFGLFVQLSDYYVDGLVPVRTLSDDYYVFDPVKHQLEGRDKHRKYTLADPLEVVLTGVDPRHRSLDLKIVQS